MSNVTLTIGGRHYTVACGEGEEDHIENLGRLIDGKISSLPNMAGQSEPRTLLFAALLLADEIYELKSRNAPAAAAADEGQVAETLESLAESLESLAARLESRAPTT